jgi:hypothetical protein
VRLLLARVARKPKRCTFDHQGAVQSLNARACTFNEALARCGRELDANALALSVCHAARTGGITVVSFCDGKATLLGVLLRAGVRVRRYLSVECEHNANRVARALYGGGWDLLAPGALRFFADGRQLTVAGLRRLDTWPVHLFASSTPCNDLSACNESGEGLHGPSSNLFVDMCALERDMRADNDGIPLCVLAENVVPTQKADAAEMNESLGLPALCSQAAVWEAASRLRLLWTNLRQVEVPSSVPNKLLQDVLNPGAVALSDKAGCIISGLIEGVHDSVTSHGDHSKRNRGRTLVQCSPFSTDVRGLLIIEMARALGQPDHEVDASSGSDCVRAGLLGRSVSCGQMRHALSVFIAAHVQSHHGRPASDEEC